PLLRGHRVRNSDAASTPWPTGDAPLRRSPGKYFADRTSTDKRPPASAVVPPKLAQCLPASRLLAAKSSDTPPAPLARPIVLCESRNLLRASHHAAARKCPSGNPASSHSRTAPS